MLQHVDVLFYTLSLSKIPSRERRGRRGTREHEPWPPEIHEGLEFTGSASSLHAQVLHSILTAQSSLVTCEHSRLVLVFCHAFGSLDSVAVSLKDLCRVFLRLWGRVLILR